MFSDFSGIEAEFPNLSHHEIERSRDVFTSQDKDFTNYLDEEKFERALEIYGHEPSGHEFLRVIAQIDGANRGVYYYRDFLQAITYIKTTENKGSENDYIDAFVAMGGNVDKTGKIDCSRLIEVIKKEYDLTIDIEKLLREVDLDGSGAIEYNEFRTLLSN